MRRLTDLHPGAVGIISDLAGDRDFRMRLLAMGFTPGTRVELRKRAPLGDPMEISLRGCMLMIRRRDAAKILLK